MVHRIALLLIFFVSASTAPVRAPFEIWAGLPEIPENHFGHYPFISSLTFRSICDHIIDHATEFDPDVVQKGDIIYLNCWYLPWFVTYIHDKIKNPYILVTCDTNTWLPYPRLKELIYDNKCAAWFGRQMLFSYHPKLFQIPMGQDLFFFDRGLETRDILLKCTSFPLEKKHLLYMNFYARAAGDRQKVVQLFENAPYCFSRNKTGVDWDITNRELFYNEISSSKFVLSPWGVEFECLRTWESLVLGSIPIVEHSFLDPLYKDLPILLIHNWEEIDENLLNENYEALKKKPIEMAFFDYWKSLIKETQFKVRYGDFPSTENTKFSHEDLEDLGSLLEENNPYLLYRGSLTLSRPLQVANAFPSLSKIFLFDRWFNESLKRETQIDCTIQTESQFEAHLEASKPCQIFLDFTYQRSSLLRQEELLQRDWELIRHNLKADLYALFDQLKIGSRIIGNMSYDDYVQEVLDQIVKEKKWEIRKKGSFWILFKTIDEVLPDPHPQIYENIPPSAILMPKDFPFDFLLNGNRPKLIIEIAAQSSCSSSRFAQFLADEGKLFTVEFPENDREFLSNIVYAEQTHKIIPVKRDSAHAVKIIKSFGMPVDLIYIHGMHPSQPIYNDLKSWFPLLSKQGILCGGEWSLLKHGIIRFAQENTLKITYNSEFWMLTSN